jgi:hypothetical protein
MGRAESEVVRNQKIENYRKVYVQWWVPMKKGVKNDEQLYHNCWLSKWKCNHANLKNGLKYLSSCFLFNYKQYNS